VSFEIVEPDNAPGDLDSLEKELSAAVTATKAAPNAESDDTKQPAGGNEPAIPEKYRGKSVEEIIAMHQNLESAYGRMANDLGQQRKFTDALIQMELKRSDDLRRNTPATEEPEIPEVSVAEILDNPTAALEKYYAARRARDERELRERLDSMETDLARGRFVAKHPDANEIGNDPAFTEWLTESPLRQRAAQAALNGDWQTADELLTEYKATRQKLASKDKATTPHKDPDVEAARRASLESSTDADAGKGSGGRVYRRADLIRLKLEKPHVYESDDFQREILRAYAEGRVK
jgi:hypothetical protein